ncbi:hypothetical protein LguiA_017666 [Lonicera macranthoides]
MASSLLRNVRHSRPSALVESWRSRCLSTDTSLAEYRRGEIGAVSGIPDEHLQRRSLIDELYMLGFGNVFRAFQMASSNQVVIFSPARSATQQGSGKLGKWKINFVSTQKWENPLMGWTSTGDPYAHVGDSAMGFDSEQDAIGFAERHGWDYTVKKRQTPLLKVRAYADNFKWKGPPPTQEA